MNSRSPFLLPIYLQALQRHLNQATTFLPLLASKQISRQLAQLKLWWCGHEIR
ncbi:hypothetical protein H6F76_05345 [Leptolyngbya sp. FACHB-321]|nr:hypothetical protein [Leptolyngbya sp. FACHB-321]